MQILIRKLNEILLIYTFGDCGGCEEAEPEIAGAVDDDIRGDDAVLRGLWGWGYPIKEVTKRAVHGAVWAAAGVYDEFKYCYFETESPWEFD